MKEYKMTNIISAKEHLERAYIELLKIYDWDLRIKLQGEMCSLRNLLVELTGESMQEIQDTYEEIALKERIRDGELVRVF